MTSGQHIDYDALALEALRGVVKACLAQVARTGLVGDHHFYIAFDTQAPGVGMSKRLKEKYPVEMTIVLQHRFWDLAVDEERFEVKLTFDGIPERLVVPFSAVKVFYDPSVPYVLQFEDVGTGGEARRGSRKAPGGLRRGGEASPDMTAAAGGGAAPEPAGGGDLEDRVERRRLARRRTDRSDETPTVPDKTAGDEAAPAKTTKSPAPAAPAAASPKPSIVAVGKADEPTKEDAAASEAGAETEVEAEAGSSAKIFDLSKFRGKK